MNVRVEDLPRIPQNQITQNTLLYSSNNGIAYSAGIVDIASQVSGVTGSYVVNSQLSGTSGVLQTQIVSSGSNNFNTIKLISGNTVFITGVQTVVGVKNFLTGFTAGLNPNLFGVGLMAVGKSAVASASQAIAFSEDSTAAGPWSFSAGFSSNASNRSSFALGEDAQALGNLSYVLGGGGVANGDYSIVFGRGGTTNHVASLVIGMNDLDGVVDVNDNQWVSYFTGNYFFNGSPIYTQGIYVNNIPVVTGILDIQNIVLLTGNQRITGFKSFASNIVDKNNTGSINVDNRTLLSFGQAVSGGPVIPYGCLNWQALSLNNIKTIAVDWSGLNLVDFSKVTGLNWGNRIAYDTINNNSIDWGNRLTYDSSQNKSIDYGGRFLYDNSNIIAIDWLNRRLRDANGSNVVDWGNYIISDNLSAGSIDWKNRKLLDTGVSASIDYQNRILTGTILADWEGYKVFKGCKINFLNTGIYNLYQIPVNYLFNIDSMEIITTDSVAVTGAPWIEFGNNNNISGYFSLFQTISTGILARDIRNSPSDAISGGLTLNATVYSGTTGFAHSGFLIIRGYLIKAQ